MIDVGTLVSGLILAAVTAIAYVAYKHPSGYNRALTYLLAILLFGFVTTTMWDIGRMSAHSDLREFIPIEHSSAARKKMDSGKPLGGWYVLIYLGAVVYLYLLSLLPTLLGEQDEENKKG